MTLLQNMIDFAQGLHHVFDFICTDKTSIKKIQQFMAMSYSQKTSLKPKKTDQKTHE